MKAPTTYMGIDQFGHTYHGLKHPRKDLSKILSGRISKMYGDTKNGEVTHVGYVIGPLWITIYEVIPFHGGRP